MTEAYVWMTEAYVREAAEGIASRKWATADQDWR